jgi:peptide/nickel transport system substrate-binding protein
MNILTCVLLGSLLLFSSLLPCVLAAPPAIQRQMEIIEATIDGGSGPSTVDPANCYDTASGELLMNVYDTLVSFDGEHVDRYLPQLATEWNLEKNDPPVHDVDTGLDWYYTYFFKIRNGVKFHNISLPELSAEDVEYCFERGMVLDMASGPQWMFYEPLLNGANHDYINGVTYNIEGNVTDEILVGKMIDHAIESNSTHVWFNLAFPGAYAPFMQILSQPWSSIYSKTWALSLGRPSIWPGTWGSYDSWSEYCNLALPPLDDPEPVEMGTGPFVSANLDWELLYSLKYWEASRFTNYWRGWGSGPAPNYGIGWPTSGNSKPAGYIDHLKVSWAWNWTTRSTMFLNGDVDFCAVPRQYISQMVGQAGVRCIYPLPSMQVDVLLFNQNVNPLTFYGTIFDYGVLGEDGIPRDFFSDVHARKAFAQAIDYDAIIGAIPIMGEAIKPATAIIQGLPYYNASIAGYSFNLANAANEFATAWNGELPETGFTVTLVYNAGNIMRMTLFEMLKTNIEAMNPKYHVVVTAFFWPYDDIRGICCFVKGWLADYPDPHDFAYAFYYSRGIFAGTSSYSDPEMDALIETGIRTPDGPARAAKYSQIQQRIIDTCPSAALQQPIGRHFERDWVVGWYYNSIYSGVYAANLWKWYYTPHAQQDTLPANSTGNFLPYDVNYDGKTNMMDIGAAALCFGAIYGPPISPKWNFRCDFNDDRKIDMKDIGGVAQNFGKTSSPWSPPT